MKVARCMQKKILHDETPYSQIVEMPSVFCNNFVWYLEHGAVHGIGACFVLKISFWVTEGIEALSRL